MNKEYDVAFYVVGADGKTTLETTEKVRATNKMSLVDAVRQICQDRAWKFLGISQVAAVTQPHPACDFVATVRPVSAIKPARRRPTMRGGRPIGPPDLGVPTMATRRREESARRGGKR